MAILKMLGSNYWPGFYFSEQNEAKKKKKRHILAATQTMNLLMREHHVCSDHLLMFSLDLSSECLGGPRHQGSTDALLLN